MAGFTDPNALFFVAGLSIVGTVGLVIFTSMGYNLNLAGKMNQIKDEAETKSNVIRLPADKQPRILCSKKNFDETINAIVKTGFDEKTGLSKLRFMYGDDQLAPFEVLDDSNAIRRFGSFIDAIVQDSKPVYEIIEGDVVDNITKMKANAEMQTKLVLDENARLRKTHKEISKDFAETYNSVRKGMFGVYGQGGGGGYTPFVRPWFNRYGGAPVGGGEEGGGEEGGMQ